MLNELQKLATVKAMISFMRDKDRWMGTTTDLCQEINQQLGPTFSGPAMPWLARLYMDSSSPLLLFNGIVVKELFISPRNKLCIRKFSTFDEALRGHMQSVPAFCFGPQYGEAA